MEFKNLEKIVRIVLRILNVLLFVEMVKRILERSVMRVNDVMEKLLVGLIVKNLILINLFVEMGLLMSERDVKIVQ
jgi:hypothetical protein